MRKDKNMQLILIGVLSIVVAGMSIGFAAYSQSLIISSQTSIQPSTWRVGFYNESDGICNEQSGTGTISNVSLNNLAISFNAELNNVGDYVEYTACIANTGTIDAELTSIDLPDLLTTEQKKYIKIDYGYGDYPQISIEDATNKLNYNTQEYLKYMLDTPLRLTPDNKHTFIIRIEYYEPDNPEDLPDEPEDIYISTTFNYDQT